MADKAAILSKLDEMESEMKCIGFWNDNPPDQQAAMACGGVENYLDAPSFELWLQTVFLSNARKAAAEDNLPRQSQVGEMAIRQCDFHSSIPKAN